MLCGQADLLQVTITFSVLSRHCPIHIRTANLTLKISAGRRPYERLAPSTGPQSISSAGKSPPSMCSRYQTYKANPTLSYGVAQKPKLGGANLALGSLPENRLLCACPCLQVHTFPQTLETKDFPRHKQHTGTIKSLVKPDLSVRTPGRRKDQRRPALRGSS